NLATHQAGREVDEQRGGASAVVKEGVEFDEIETGHQSAVMQHFHHQMRLAEGRTAGNGGADRRSCGGIKKIDIETDMQQPSRLRNLVEKALQRCSDAVFVYGSHVIDGDVACSQRRSLCRIDTA